MDMNLWLDVSMDQTQLYGLAFLLGSYSVATLSDIKRMSAQSEFVSIWAIIAIGLFIIDVYLMGVEKLAWELWAAKWSIIVFFSIISHERVGIYFRLATGDVVAIMAAAALLAPVLVLSLYVVMKIMDLVLAPFLKSFGTKSAYPFMPVVFATTVIVLAFGHFVLRGL